MDSELIGYFNHRVMKKDDDFGFYKIVLVHYELDKTPTDYSEATMESFDPSDLYTYALEIMEAFARPLIEEKDIDFSRSILDKEDKMIGACHTEKLND